MYLALRMQLTQRMEPRIQLSQEVKILLRLQQTVFRHGPFANAARGKLGLCRAHEILCARGAVGLVIGGIAESLWRGYGWQRLEKHKDVDVLVISNGFELSQPFEGGIDWWLPTDERIRARTDSGDLISPVRFWSNGNGVCLAFGASSHADLAPGLYAPSPDFLSAMRAHEVIDGVAHPAGTEISGEDNFLELLSRRYSQGFSQQTRRFFDPRVFALSKLIAASDEALDPSTIGILQLRYEIAAAVRAGNFVS